MSDNRLMTVVAAAGVLLAVGGCSMAASTMVPPVQSKPAAAYAKPAAWCTESVAPDRCRPRAASDDAWCRDAMAPERYRYCRRTMDYIGWHL